MRTRIQDAFDNIVHAHRVVREAIDRLQRTKDVGDAARALADLDQVLPGHFRAEERPDGFFDHLRRALHGDVERQVAGLVTDHREMEVELKALLEAEEHDEAWLERAKRFGRRLRDHEQAEARLGATPVETHRL